MESQWYSQIDTFTIVFFFYLSLWYLTSAKFIRSKQDNRRLLALNGSNLSLKLFILASHTYNMNSIYSVSSLPYTNCSIVCIYLKFNHTWDKLTTFLRLSSIKIRIIQLYIEIFYSFSMIALRKRKNINISSVYSRHKNLQYMPLNTSWIFRHQDIWWNDTPRLLINQSIFVKSTCHV